jgi:hypothetical protein
VRGLAVQLGAPKAEAATLAALVWKLYRTRRLDPELWTAQCRNGGPYDQDASDVWP